MNICSKLVIHTTDKKQNLVFNGYTGSLDIVTSQIATFLKKRNIDDPNLGKSDRSSLEEAKYILMDEDALADAIFKRYIDYTSTALEDSDTYVICPTLNCNLFCSYCYEKGKCRRNHHLDENSLNAIFDFMTQRSVHNNRAGHISFFGGEPLLSENTEINKKILQYARKHGFSCDITTNGTTIKDVHVATLLRENHDLIKSIQISIDGTKEYHDNMKFTVDGCGTFDLVMENILSLLRMGILVFVRINISRNNINEIEELTDYFMNSQLCYPTRRGDEKHPLLQMNDSSQMSGVSISTSRGCPFRCVYCDISAFYHRLRRERSVENIADEMEYLYKAKRITYFSFTDDNFIGGSKHGNERAYMFVDELKKRNIPIRFNMEIRVTDATRDLLSALKSVGLYHVNMGIESGSQSMLDRWKKGIYVQDSINAIQIVEAVGLRYNINYILVDAYTTFDELLESYEFIKKTRAIEKSDEYFHIFTNELGVIHGTPIASEMKSSGLLFPKKMCRATPEEQEILDHYHPMYSYSFVDPHVDCFITNNRYWTNIVARIIENISDAEIYSRGFRRFCFRLFTLSIRAAKEKDIIFDDLSTEIESYCTFKGISF